MERFLAGGTNGRILLVAHSAVERVVAVWHVRKRSVDELRFTLDADETLLMPVFLLDTDVLHTVS